MHSPPPVEPSVPPAFRPDLRPDLRPAPRPAAGPRLPRDGEVRAGLRWGSWVELLRERAQQRPAEVCLFGAPNLLEIGRSLSWAQLDRQARAVAAALQQRTAGGDRCLLLLDNDLDYVIAFFACAYAGRVGVTLHVPTQKKHVTRLGQVAADCGAELVLSTAALRARFGPAVDAAVPGARWLEVDGVSEALAIAWEPHRPAPEDTCYLQYTSGSTSAPRGVVVSHQSLLAQGEILNGIMGFHEGDRALSWLPLFHDMGLILGLLQPLYTGFPVILTTPAAFIKDPARWLRALSAHQITYAGGPNFCYDLCVDTVDREALADIDLSRWSVALNAAEPVRARTLDRFAAWARPLGFRPEAMHPGYGLAEATLGVTAKPRGSLPVRRAVDPEALRAHRVEPPLPGGPSQELVSSGAPATDTALRIVDPEGPRALGPLWVGEIWVAGSAPAEGYLNRPDETEHSFRARLPGDPWAYLRTGDLGFVDEQGHLFITGRAKDLIIVRGRNHYPQDLEQTAEALHPCLRGHWVAAFAVEGAAEEEVVIVAEVRAEAVGEVPLDEVAALVLRGVAARHELRVAEVLLVSQRQVPKTTSGKIQRALCRELWVEGSFDALARARAGGAA
jgi:acyl-CoA synthetase (AMP-forming)/AMP-acid ligase II